MREFDELKPQIATWYADFARHGIPVSAYTELFDRAFDLRVTQMSRGETPMPMDSPLLVSQWIGPNGLAKELRKRDKERGRTLSANAASVCKWCMGSGWRPGDVDDPSKGVTRCDHSEPQPTIDF